MDNELYHYGRLGMKWGKNIFGKKESNTEPSTPSRREKARDETIARYKNYIKRRELVKQYKYLDPTSVAMTKARKYAFDILRDLGQNTLENIGTQFISDFDSKSPSAATDVIGQVKGEIERRKKKNGE